jgi:hypothetical protein
MFFIVSPSVDSGRRQAPASVVDVLPGQPVGGLAAANRFFDFQVPSHLPGHSPQHALTHPFRYFAM